MLPYRQGRDDFDFVGLTKHPSIETCRQIDFGGENDPVRLFVIWAADNISSEGFKNHIEKRLMYPERDNTFLLGGKHVELTIAV